MPGLIERLIERPQGFDLFQALHLLERAEPARKPVGGSLGLDEAVRLSGHVGLEFPPSDIHALGASRQPGPALTLSSAAMTLAGAQGPLPLVFTELLLQAQRARHPAGLALLDIFQQRLLAFLYRARRKHRVALAPEPVEAAPVLRVLDALSGLGRGEGARAPGGQPAWLRHAGLQGAAPRSMASLLALLRDRLGVRAGARLRRALARADARDPGPARSAQRERRACGPCPRDGCSAGHAGLESHRRDRTVHAGAPACAVRGPVARRADAWLVGLAGGAPPAARHPGATAGAGPGRADLSPGCAGSGRCGWLDPPGPVSLAGGTTRHGHAGMRPGPPAGAPVPGSCARNGPWTLTSARSCRA